MSHVIHCVDLRLMSVSDLWRKYSLIDCVVFTISPSKTEDLHTGDRIPYIGGGQVEFPKVRFTVAHYRRYKNRNFH